MRVLAGWACWVLTCVACATVPRGPAEGDFTEVTVAQLQQRYANRTSTVTEVVRWHLARIDRYDGLYHALETVYRHQALADAARLDEALARGAPRGPLFGVPVVVKANMSVAGEVTSDGWVGFTDPGHPLVAPKDAEVVRRLRAAGAVILGHSNMPDFANSDTNRSTAGGRTGNAYDVRFSPGGSSGGTVTAVAASFAVLGLGTDTGNSIRMPAATSGLVGVFPTRGSVSLEGIAPLDWQLDNVGPIARTAADAAVALGVLAAPAPTVALQPGALKGKRFGVPAFILEGHSAPFHGIPAGVEAREPGAWQQTYAEARVPLHPKTRAAFERALDQLRAAGATVVEDPALLPEAFARLASHVATYPYVVDGFSRFLAAWAPRDLSTLAAWERAGGQPLPSVLLGDEPSYSRFGGLTVRQVALDQDPAAGANLHQPRAQLRAAYEDAFARFQLDGLVYPATQLPPPDETLPQDGRLSEGPHSATSWLNMVGAPAVVVAGGDYPGGLPFGLEFSARPARDAELLEWAWAWELATHHRHPPVLVDRGLLPNAP